MTALIIIPARLASSRLPGKPLLDICGRTMIARVVDAARSANIGPVAVAAADPEIVEEIQNIGADAILTDPDLPSGTDRVHAAAQHLDAACAHDVVINLQGDMPTITPDALRAVLAALEAEPEADIATLAVATDDPRERDDPNAVKAIIALRPDGRRGRALYFTRSPAPSGAGPVWHHVGVYAFRRAALARFTSLPPSELEQRERLEQLRALENGMRIETALIDAVPEGVDAPADLERARAWFAAEEDDA